MRADSIQMRRSVKTHQATRDINKGANYSLNYVKKLEKIILAFNDLVSENKLQYQPKSAIILSDSKLIRSQLLF